MGSGWWGRGFRSRGRFRVRMTSRRVDGKRSGEEGEGRKVDMESTENRRSGGIWSSCHARYQVSIQINNATELFYGSRLSPVQSISSEFLGKPLVVISSRSVGLLRFQENRFFLRRYVFDHPYVMAIYRIAKKWIESRPCSQQS